MKLQALPYHVNVIKTTASLIREGEVHMFAVKGRVFDVQLSAPVLSARLCTYLATSPFKCKQASLCTVQVTALLTAHSLLVCLLMEMQPLIKVLDVVVCEVIVFFFAFGVYVCLQGVKR